MHHLSVYVRHTEFMMAASGALMGLDHLTPTSLLLITPLASLWPVPLSACIFTQQIFHYSWHLQHPGVSIAT